jgi:glycosyltransferase 2 family protein
LKKILISVAQYIIFIGLGVVLLYLTFRGKDLNKIKEILLSANYLWIIISLAIAYIALFVRAYRWNLLIEPLGYKPKLINTYHALTIGYMSNYALPRIGEVVRCGTLSRIEKLPPEVLFGTVIAERAFDVLCLVLLTIFTVLLNLGKFGSFLKINVFDVLSKKVSASLNSSSLFWIFVLVSLIAVSLLTYIFWQRIKNIVVVKKIGNLGKGIMAGIKTVLQLKRKKAFIFHTFLMWACYYLMTYIIFFSIPSTSGLSPVSGLFILVLGSYGMAAPVQGGMGAFHSMVFLGLTGLYGISKEESIASAVLMHEPQLVGLVIFGAISMGILILRKKK